MAVEAPSEVLIIDRNAASPTGHHAHWYDRLAGSLTALGITHVKSTGQDGLSANVESWYTDEIKKACRGQEKQLIFTAGDEALMPALRHAFSLRRTGKAVHLFLFRMERQPRPSGLLVLWSKLAVVILLKSCIEDLNAYVLHLPVGEAPQWHRSIGLIPVLDSSAIETNTPLGKADARRIYGDLIPSDHKIILVIGILGRGKHVDTLIDAWRHGPPVNASLVFAGEAPTDIDAMLRASAEEAGTIHYLPGRVSDNDFDRLIEGADAVAAIYRYSASSGIVLRALSLGTRVLVGGSSVLVRQLRGVDGVSLARNVRAPAISEALGEVLTLPAIAPMVRDADAASIYPAPIVQGIQRFRTEM